MAASPTDPAAAKPLAEDVVGLLVRATDAAARHGREDLVERIRGEQDRLLAQRCQVLVVGEFKQGKSSLVNALLNAEVCAADADAATAVPTLVRYGIEPAATVLTDLGTTQSAAPVAMDGVAALVTDDRSSRRRRDHSDRVRAVDVQVPRDLLRAGLVLVDTPGVGGGLDSAHAAATLRALTAADVLLFVSDAGAEYTASELEFLRRAAELCPTVLCALTKIDFYSDWRRILAADIAHLGQVGLSYEVLPLSAPLRHQGVRSADSELLMESGYPRLAAMLRAAAAANAGKALAGAAAVAHSALTQLVSRLSTQLQGLRDPTGAGDARSRWTAARERAEQLKSGGARWQQVLADGIADLASTVDRDLTARMRTLRKEAADRIASDDPARDWAELTPWLNRGATEALLGHRRTVGEVVDAVAETVARQFGTSAWELRVTVDVPEASSAVRDVELAAVAADRSSRLELGLLAARGGSTGVILTHTAGLVLGLALPVTLPVTAVLAGLLARKTWGTARAAQLRVLRAEAGRAVSAYLDEVESGARTDSRDAVRGVQRQLREVFAQRAAELYASTAQNLEALSLNMRQDESGRLSRVEEVTAELTELRALAGRAAAVVDQLLPPQALAR